MLFGDFLRANVREFITVSIARPTRRLRTESERHARANVISHFLRDHFGVDGAPVPLVLVGHIEPGYAVEDDGLGFDAGGTVLVPYTLDPEVDVNVFLVVIDEGCLGGLCRIIKPVGRT